MKRNHKKLGDFTGLAGDYSKYRVGYCESVLTCLLSLVEKTINKIDFVDVGAGTGIWTRMVANRGCRSIVAVEPNDEMREYGELDSKEYNIEWKSGSAENTGLDECTCDFITMASSFHWADFDSGIKELHRVLRKGGRLAVLWNPRMIESNPILVEIEETLYRMVPNLKRISSGKSGIIEVLTEKLSGLSYFSDLVYIEGRHNVSQTSEQYLGVWWSVNDIRSQAGEGIFSEFMEFVKQKIRGLEKIETSYITRALSVKKYDT